MGKKRLAIAAVVVVLLVGTLAVLWHVLDRRPSMQAPQSELQPSGKLGSSRSEADSLGRYLRDALGLPPRVLTRKHGPSCRGGPTGRYWRDSYGMEYAEVAPGYCHIDLRMWSEIRGRRFRSRVNRTRWIELTSAIWISTTPLVTTEEYRDADDIGKMLANRAADPPRQFVGRTLRFATADQLQFADMWGALETGDGAIGLSIDEPSG